jgi:GxxExxY protein
MNTDKNIKALDKIEATEPVYPEQELTGKILECAFAVHNALGAGFLERVYSNALAHELQRSGIDCVREAPLKVTYRDVIVGDYVADILVAGRVLMELKACAVLDSNHAAQIMNYLRASGIRVGLLLNFGRPKLEYRRFVC